MKTTWPLRFFAVLVLLIGAPLGSSVSVARAEPLPRVVPGTGTVVEGDAGSVVLQLPVTLSAPTDVAVTADWSTIFGPGVTPPAPAEPGVDFQAASGTVRFDPGVTATTIELTVFGDVDVERDEQVIAAFRNATNATIGGFYGLGVGVITNDDKFTGTFPFAMSFGPVSAPFRVERPACMVIQSFQFTGAFVSFGPSDISVQLCVGELDPTTSLWPILSGSLSVSSDGGVLNGVVTGGDVGTATPTLYSLLVDFDLNGGTGIYTGAAGTAHIEGNLATTTSLSEFRASGEFTGSFTLP